MLKSEQSRKYVRIFKEVKSLCDLALSELDNFQFSEDTRGYCQKIISQIKIKTDDFVEPSIKSILPIDQNTFDPSFSSEFFTFDKENKKATWLKPSTNNLYSDYNYYPIVRMRNIITDTRTFKIKITSYGWFGVGSQNIRNDGFPGYTTEGWMLCTDGRVFHNKNQIKAYSLKLADIEIVVKVDAQKGEMEVNGVKIQLGQNVPKALYFIVSVRSQTIEILQ